MFDEGQLKFHLVTSWSHFEPEVLRANHNQAQQLSKCESWLYFTCFTLQEFPKSLLGNEEHKRSWACMYFFLFIYWIKMRFIQLWLTMTSISMKLKVLCLRYSDHDSKNRLVHTVWQLWRWAVCHVLGHFFLCLGHQSRLSRTAHAAALAWSHHCNPAERENSLNTTVIIVK